MEIINTAISKFKQPLYELFEQNEAIKNEKSQKNSFFSRGFSFHFWDLEFFVGALPCLNFILNHQVYKSFGFEQGFEL